MLTALHPRAFAPRLIGIRWQSSSTTSFFRSPAGSSRSPDSDLPSTTTYNTNKDLRSHPEIHAKLNPAPRVALDMLSPLKSALYKQNLAENNGLYKNNQIIKHEGKAYRLDLSRREQMTLEPSVYAQSYRIKGSWKKSYMFLRIFRRMALDDAITQCHFSSRRMARDVGEMLERGKKDAEVMGLASGDLIVDQIWVGKDGQDEKRLQCKGRGRTGVITSHYVHVKAILKPSYIYAQRKEWAKNRLDKKLWFPLRNWKIKEDFIQTANYKW